MKCPACEFIFFDGRDICPKCMLDLRSYKKSMGIAISNPDTPYKELIKQRLNSSSIKRPTPADPSTQANQAATNNKPGPGYLSRFTNKLLDRNTEAQKNSSIKADGTTDSSAANTSGKEAEIHEIKTSIHDLAHQINQLTSKSGPKVIEFTEDENSIDQILTELELDSASNKSET